MADPIALVSDMVEALDGHEVQRLRRLVPRQFWGWLDDYLALPSGWQTVEALAGAPREIIWSRLVRPGMARIALRGPAGEAFVTATFDNDGLLKGFALEGEEYEGIGTIVIACPDEMISNLRAFFAALIPQDARSRPRLHFDEGNRYRPPRWPDPQHPQQLHLDIHVEHLDQAYHLVEQHAATLLFDCDDHRVYADPIGHPFCLYPAERTALWRVVIDCPDPVALENFYTAFLGSDTVPKLAFQKVSPYVAPRWPDPAFPAQMHFDVKVDNRAEVQERIERLGAVPLPPQGGSCPVYADPAGHPFCLCLHGE